MRIFLAAPLFFTLMLLAERGSAQSTSERSISNTGNTQSILEGYIKRGLDSNLAIHQQRFDLEQAQLDLKRARTLFYPQASLNSQYMLAAGGRTQDIPVGDLLNGVYATLNQLTSSSKFPRVYNQKISFLPNDFQDTRLEVALPLINTDIYYNRKIKEEMVHAREADLEIYRRDLVKDIKQAYYQYLQSWKAIDIYTNALLLVQENQRVSEKLFNNDMGSREAVLRSKAQVSQVQSSLIEAGNARQNAQAYFNFLLNRPLETAVAVDSGFFSAPVSSPVSDLPAFPAHREELRKLHSLQHTLDAGYRLNRSYFIPHLSLFYHAGFQGFGFRFGSDQFYQVGGLQLEMPLFRANDNKFKVKQSQLQIDALADKYKEVEQRLALQVNTAYNNYRSALQLLEAVTSEVESARETYRFADRRFREGQALQIELIDARAQMTNAQLRQSIAQLAVLNRAADLERATASYNF